MRLAPREEEGGDLRTQGVEVERLVDEVVRAELACSYLDHLVEFGGEHKHREVVAALLSERFHHLIAVWGGHCRSSSSMSGSD